MLVSPDASLPPGEPRRGAPPWATGRPELRYLVLFFAAYFLGAGVAHSLAIVPDTGISIWPASGVFMATLILVRRASWPWWIVTALLGEMVANLLWFHNPAPVALLIFAGNAVEAMAGAWLVGLVCKLPLRLVTVTEVLALVLLGAGVAPVASATIGSATLAWFGIQPFLTAWPLWWIGDATGVLIAAPLTLVVVQNWQDKARLSTARRIEAGLVALVFLIVASLALGGYLAFAYIIMPPLLWAAVRFELRGAVLTLVLLAVMTGAFTIAGDSQFAGTDETQREKQILLQLFLAISAMSALVVAAISHQHQQALLRLQTVNNELEHRVAERTADLRESEARLRLTLSAGRAGTWDHDVATGNSIWSGAHFRLLGLEPTPDGKGDVSWWRDAILPEDRERVLAEWRRAELAGDLYVSEYRIRRHDDNEIAHLYDTGQFTYDADGRPTRFSGVVFDVTELKRHEQRQQMLIHELNHRVKNTLATVQSIAMQSLRGSGEAHLAENFASRLSALAGGHDLLAGASWTGATLGDVVNRAIAPYRGGEGTRCTAVGPYIWMPARQALAVTMALHELCTNAAKYGALSNDAGRVDLSWELLDDGDSFRLTWREHGGPRVEPPTRRGFGSRLLERGLKQDLDGTIEIDYRPSGVVCVVEAPLPKEAARRELDLQEGA